MHAWLLEKGDVVVKDRATASLANGKSHLCLTALFKQKMGLNEHMPEQVFVTCHSP